MKKWFTLILCSTLFLVATPSLADLRQADALFAKRGEGRNVISGARVLYKQLLDQASGDELIYIVSQLGRLAIYEGEMFIPKEDRSSRAAVFAEFWCHRFRILGGCASEGIVGYINPARVGENTPYYYFKGATMAFWAKASSAISVAGNASEMKRIINLYEANPHNFDTRFEGGGMDRLVAGVYSNDVARPLGLYKPHDALEYVDAALGRGANADGLTGADFFENQIGRAIVLLSLAKHYERENQSQRAAAYKAEVKIWLEDRIEEFDEMVEDEELPEGREPESLWTLKEMKKKYALHFGEID